MDEPESIAGADARGAREARQPDLRHQLQPAAARRPGARQRPDHPGARVAVHRRRLERHQGAVGLGLGRAVRARHARTRCCARFAAHASTASTRRSAPTTAPTTASTSSASDPELQRAGRAHDATARSTRCKRGGHDFRKLYAAFAAARAHRGQPTVILAKTKKGYGMGGAGESRMTSHQQKKLDVEALLAFRDRFELPLSDDDVAALRFYQPADDSPEMRLPARAPRRARRLPAGAPRRGAGGRRAAARRLRAASRCRPTARRCRRRWRWCACSATCCKDPALGPRIVPIVADEARTFGMASLFRQVGIYSPRGPALRAGGRRLDARTTARRRDGQLLEEGITEAGALSSWTAAATVVQRARPADAAVLHLLLDVRLPARRRPDLGRRRPARARLPARRDRRPHHAGRRRPAAPGRHAATCRRDGAQLPRLRSGVRLRARGDRRPRHAPDAGAAATTCSTTSR